MTASAEDATRPNEQLPPRIMCRFDEAATAGRAVFGEVVTPS
jgi:hypothetical protein